MISGISTTAVVLADSTAQLGASAPYTRSAGFSPALVGCVATFLIRPADEVGDPVHACVQGVRLVHVLNWDLPRSPRREGPCDDLLWQLVGAVAVAQRRLEEFP